VVLEEGNWLEAGAKAPSCGVTVVYHKLRLTSKHEVNVCQGVHACEGLRSGPGLIFGCWAVGCYWAAQHEAQPKLSNCRIVLRKAAGSCACLPLCIAVPAIQAEASSGG
jgi:hypothetical protein